MLDIFTHRNSTPARLFIKCMCQWVGGRGVVLVQEAGILALKIQHLCFLKKKKKKTKCHKRILGFCVMVLLTAWALPKSWYQMPVGLGFGCCQHRCGNCDSGPNSRLELSFPLWWTKSRSWLVSGPCSHLRWLETSFSKENTEEQLLSAELFSLPALAACPWPTDPEQQLDLTSNFASLSRLHHSSQQPELSKYAFLQVSKMCTWNAVVLLAPPLAKTRCRKLNRCNIRCLCVETVEISYSETYSKNPGCLTGLHANTAITGGRKLASAAATNPLV